MAEFPALPFWTDAYLADTIHLNTREHGAYLLLLITAWRTADCALPDDDKLLARYARMDMRGWRSMRPVLEQFFTISQGKWIQKRLQKERKYVEEQRRKNSENARARWLKNNNTDNATAMPNGCQTDAPTPTPTPIPIDTPLPVSTTEPLLDTALPTQTVDQTGFDRFWDEVPRKIGKGQARRAYKAARKKASDPELLEAMKAFAERCNGTDLKFICHPATWLNGERWLDETPESRSEQDDADLEAICQQLTDEWLEETERYRKEREARKNVCS